MPAKLLQGEPIAEQIKADLQGAMRAGEKEKCGLVASPQGLFSQHFHDRAGEFFQLFFGNRQRGRQVQPHTSEF